MPEALEPLLGAADARLSGEIDVAKASAIGDDLCAAIHRQPRLMVVDISDVSFVDSTAIAMMIRVHNYGEILRRSVEWRGVQPQVARVLEITGADQLLHLVHT